MSKKRNRDRTESKKRTVLEGHKRIGKKFLPPMRQLPGAMSEVSWVNRILPELIWMGVLNDNLGVRRGVELSSQLARLAHETYAEKKSPNFAFTSSYAELDANKKNLLLKELEAVRVLTDLTNGLIGFLSLYPESPLSFLSSAGGEENFSSFVNSFKATLDKHFIRREKPAMVIQANVVHVAEICGKLFYTKNVAPPDLDALITDFDSEAGRKAAAKVRAAVTGFVGMMLGEKNDGWPRYFWNRGLQIDKCTLDGESTNG